LPGAPPERFQANEGENIQDVVARLEKEKDTNKLVEVAQNVKTKVSSGVKTVTHLGKHGDTATTADVV
jgi:hypothetical protein